MSRENVQIWTCDRCNTQITESALESGSPVGWIGVLANLEVADAHPGHKSWIRRHFCPKCAISLISALGAPKTADLPENPNKTTKSAELWPTNDLGVPRVEDDDFYTTWGPK